MTTYRSFSAVQEAIRVGHVTCRALVDHYLERIEANQQLNAFIAIYADEARTRAEEIDQKLADGTAGRLAGMVLGVKDVFCHAGHGVQAGSKILNGFVSPFSATAVARLLAEDAIIIGRQNCDEFAMGSSNESSFFGPVRNAADTNRVPGGSSGGSAVAVQAGLCLASLGSDTGGSVRQPAAFCGVVGLKPTYGRISRWGLLAYASSFDCPGPIANTVEDVALLLDVMAGPDEFDSTVSAQPKDDYTNVAFPDERPLRIAYLADGVESDAVDASIRDAMQQTLDALRDAGHNVAPVTFPLLNAWLPTYYVLTTAEASSNLSRYDGVRYGYRSAVSAPNITDFYKQNRTEGFGDEVRRRILLGTFVLSADYYDAYFTKAQRVRRLIKQEIEQVFSQFDVLLSPTTPTVAFRLGEKMGADPLKMFLADVFTVQANLTGCPALSFPAGTSPEGLPIGLQLTAPAFAERRLLGVAQYLQHVTSETNHA